MAFVSRLTRTGLTVITAGSLILGGLSPATADTPKEDVTAVTHTGEELTTTAGDTESATTNDDGKDATNDAEKSFKPADYKDPELSASPSSQQQSLLWHARGLSSKVIDPIKGIFGLLIIAFGIMTFRLALETSNPGAYGVLRSALHNRFNDAVGGFSSTISQNSPLQPAR